MKKTAIVIVGLWTCIIPMQAQKDNANTWAWTAFERPAGINPIISPNANSSFFCPMRDSVVRWEESDTFNPAAAVLNNRLVVLYRAEDNSAIGIGSRTSRIGYASSADGLYFERLGSPVLFPSKDDAEAANETPGGCEDPRVCQRDDGVFVMLYTQWNKRLPRLGVATSTDLVTWTKLGSPFKKAFDGKFARMMSKSASVVTTVKNGRQVAARIDGHYLMYWGEDAVHMATSDDLINWTPMVNADGTLLEVMKPRNGYFDSALTECGPPAVVTKDGILLFYNGKNKGEYGGDSKYPQGAYCAGQVLFDLHHPTHIKSRLDRPFLIPEADFEKSGQYPAGTVFIEGLVWFHNKWFLYYGCSDSRVAVAVYDPTKHNQLNVR